MGLNIFSKRRPTIQSPPESPTNATLEERTLAIGRSLLDAARANQSGLLSRAFWSDKLMNWSMKDPAFKVQLFRFVDAFPSLRDPDAVHEHLVDYLSQPGVTLPPGMSFGMAAGGLAKGLFTKTVTSQIEGMASKFIAGTDAADAVKQLQKLWKRRIAFSVDLLGEACVSEAEAAAYRARYLDLVEVLAREASSWPKDELLETDHLGSIPRVNVSIKISSLSAKTDPIDFEGALERSISAILPILESAKKHGVLVNFDMESHSLKDFTLELFERCCERVDFHAGLAMQAYLKSGEADAQRIIDWSKRKGKTVTVRLVKGAYWDFETIHADQQGWPTPVWSTKPETDACFERMAKRFIDAMPKSPGETGVKLALGSHNLRSIASAMAMLEARGLPKSAIELQMLHGMADALKEMAIDQGLRLREYVPVGQMLPGMAYLVRRLLENTSNESWLRAGFSDDADPEVLLKNPATSKSKREAEGLAPVSLGRSIVKENAYRATRHQLSDNPKGVGDDRPFFTEPMRDFSDARLRDAFTRAIASTRLTEVKIDAKLQDSNSAIERATKFFPTWRDTDPRARAKCLTEAARLMREKRDELSAIIIKENSKNWRNADADVCEAIDFCDYYARESIKLFEPNRLGKFAGELNQLVHQPLGVCAVISPWNFPLAISCG
ncbi:MAG TPA: proline dehydrogenase family protein, partial [Tepidisphaeraceae bacterium]|nr:proline dehydrogenase family protein [Tepidisphaeraceae bacterium]